MRKKCSNRYQSSLGFWDAKNSKQAHDETKKKIVFCYFKNEAKKLKKQESSGYSNVTVGPIRSFTPILIPT